MNVCTKKNEIANAIAAIISSRGSEKIKIQLVSNKHNKYTEQLNFYNQYLEPKLDLYKDSIATTFLSRTDIVSIETDYDSDEQPDVILIDDLPNNEIEITIKNPTSNIINNQKEELYDMYKDLRAIDHVIYDYIYMINIDV